MLHFIFGAILARIMLYVLWQEKNIIGVDFYDGKNVYPGRGRD